MKKRFLSKMGFMTHDEKEELQQEMESLKAAVGNLTTTVESLKNEISAMKSENAARTDELKSENQRLFAELKECVASARENIRESVYGIERAAKERHDRLTGVFSEMTSAVETAHTETLKKFDALNDVINFVYKENANLITEVKNQNHSDIESLSGSLDGIIKKGDLEKGLEETEDLLRLVAANQLMNYTGE